MIHSILSEKLLYALGWTVLHSLWQAFVVGIVLALLLVFLQKRSARFRYKLSGLAMLSVLIWSAITFANLYNSDIALMEEMSFGFITSATQEGNFVQILYHNFSEYFNTHLPLIVTFWLIGVAFFTLRMLGGLAYIQHLKTNYNEPLSNFWQEKLMELSNKIPLNKSVGLVESVLVKVPMVVGYFKPMILMPVGAVNNLSIEQVEAILAHELAHIYRNDYFLNILQSIIETLFYFNPAVWWISANIRSERENCCDDIAVKVCGNSLAYARALVSLQEMHQAAPTLAMPFSKNKNQLLNRVKRILNQPQNKSNIMEKITATVMLFLAMIMLSFGANLPFKNLWIDNTEEEEISIEHLVTEDFEEDVIVVKPIERDTNPKGKMRIKSQEKEDIEIRMENGKVTELKVDGKKIPEEKYGEYEKEIEELAEMAKEIPEPPAPPAPPSPFFAPAPPPAPAPPTPPSPPAVKGVPTPPSPPAPPAPTLRSKTKSRTITTEKNGDGMTTIIIEQESGKEPIEIKIEQDENGKITIDGEEVENLKVGDKMVIVEEYLDDSNGNLFFFDTDNNAPIIWNEGGKNLDNFFFYEESKDKKKDKKKLKGKSKSKDKIKDIQGNLFLLDQEGLGHVYENLGDLAVVPDVNLDEMYSAFIAPDVNLNLDFNGALALPDAYKNGIPELLVHPNGHLNMITPDNFANEKFEEYNNLMKEYTEEYNERLKDGNLGKKWKQEWAEKFEKQFPNIKGGNQFFNYTLPDNGNYKSQFEFFFNVEPDGDNQPKILKVPSTPFGEHPNLFFTQPKSSTIE